MGISQATKKEIIDILFSTIRTKLAKYNPETNHMPFHHRLLGRDRYAIFSFIQSMNTTFGISIWEQISVSLARGCGYKAENQNKLLGQIDKNTESLISNIHYRLRKGEDSPDIEKDRNLIKESIRSGRKVKDPDSTVDLFINTGMSENYIDITSAKPNMKEFAALKLKLLRWTGLRLSQNKEVNVITRLAIPYNPYHPEPYDRWTLTGLYGLNNGEILVGSDFWNFLANDDIYDELLDLFQEVGEKLRDEIDVKFSSFRALH